MSDTRLETIDKRNKLLLEVMILKQKIENLNDGLPEIGLPSGVYMYKGN